MAGDVTPIEPRAGREDLAAACATPRPAIQVEQGMVRLGGRVIWQQLDVAVGLGEFVAILGPNGAGKSTLLNVLLGLQPLEAGRVRVLGEQPGRAAGSIGYLPQRHSFDAAARMRGVDLVRLGLDGARWGFPLPFGAARRQSAARVQEVIELVGAGAYAVRPIGELSGGEQQRLLIAQALIRRPQLLMLDEPLDSLDLANQTAVAALLQGICRAEGVAVVLVAHDVNPLLSYLDTVIYLAAGGAAAGSVDEVITGPRLSALYGAPIEVLSASDGRLVVVGQPEAPHHHSHRH